MPYAPADSSFFSRRGLIFILIVLLHVGMFWALQSGLSHQLVEAVLGPIETRVIEEQKKDEEPPPPPPPKFEAPPPFVPPPEVAIDIPVDAAPTTAITQTTQTKPTYTPPVAPAPAIPSTSPKIDPKHPPTKPDYPAASRREGEAGTVQLEVYVLENGRVGEVRVKKSSGFPRLDESAVREVKRSWRFLPGTQNGKPVAMWRAFAVTFDLKDA